jgi:hypothetical protein
MRDEAAAKKKKEEIRGQMSRKRRRRKKAEIAAAKAEEGALGKAKKSEQDRQDDDDDDHMTDEEDAEYELEGDEDLERFTGSFRIDGDLYAGDGDNQRMRDEQPTPIKELSEIFSERLPAPPPAEDGVVAVRAHPLKLEKSAEEIPPSIDPFGVSNLPYKTPRELTLLKHYLYDVSAYTYRGMSSKTKYTIVRYSFLPRCQTSSTFFYASVAHGAFHLKSIADREERSTRELDLEIAGYHDIIYRDMSAALSAMTTITDDTVGVIIILLNCEVPYPSLPLEIPSPTNQSLWDQINTAGTDWPQALAAAVECTLLLNFLVDPEPSVSIIFMTRRIVWLDILSGLTLNAPPKLAQEYRKFLLRPREQRRFLRLYEMAGCEDEVIYLLSEALVLAGFKSYSPPAATALSPDVKWKRLIRHGVELDKRLVKVYPKSFLPTVRISQSATGTFFPEVPSAGDGYPSPSPSETESDAEEEEEEEKIDESYPANVEGLPSTAITAAFVLSIRIHIWSIALGFYPRLDIFRAFLKELMRVIATIPPGIMGFDRCIVWPLLVGASLATTEEERDFFVKRFKRPNAEPYATLSVVEKVFRRVWFERDQVERMGSGREVHWWDVMMDLRLGILLV